MHTIDNTLPEGWSWYEAKPGLAKQDQAAGIAIIDKKEDRKKSKRKKNRKKTKKKKKQKTTNNAIFPYSGPYGREFFEPLYCAMRKRERVRIRRARGDQLDQLTKQGGCFHFAKKLLISVRRGPYP